MLTLNQKSTGITLSGFACFVNLADPHMSFLGGTNDLLAASGTMASAAATTARIGATATRPLTGMVMCMHAYCINSS